MTISYAVVDRIEGKYLVCEVELVTPEERRQVEFLDDDQTEFIDVELSSVSESILPVKEGDILLVEHDGLKVISVLRKDNQEKERRAAVLT